MWLIPVLEVLFAAGVASLVADSLVRRPASLRPYLSGGIVAGAAAVSLFMVASELASYKAGGASVSPEPSALSTTFLTDGLSTLAALTALTVGLAVTLYSLSRSRGSDRPGPFFALVSFLLCSLLGVFSAGDLLSLFLFWEAMSICAYALVAFTKSALSLEAGLKYFLLAGVGSLLFVYGASVVYSATGTLSLDSIAAVVAQGSLLGEFGVAVIVLGLGVEAAVVPLHTWLPDVYSAAPIPVASLISGAVTAGGVFAILKVLRPFAGLGGPASLQVLLASIGVLTMLVGNLSALGQSNVRRMLSFSSVAQTGYMLAALSTFTWAGVVAAGFTIWNHALLKSGLFMTVGAARGEFEDADFGKLAGMGRRDPPSGFLFAASSFAMTGAPPFGLFWGELLVVQSLLLGHSAMFSWMALVVVLNIVLSVVYYFRAVNVVVFSEPGADEDAGRASRVSLVPPSGLLALSLLTGVVPFLLLGGLGL